MYNITNVPISEISRERLCLNAQSFFLSVKTVLRFDLDGNFIGEYDFIDGKCEKLNLKFSRIRHAVKPTHSNNFKTLSAMNSIWIMKEDFSDKELALKIKNKKKNEEEYNQNKRKRIAQICAKTNEVIQIYDSVSAAGQEHCTGYSSRCIRRVLSGERKTYAGCFWTYV